MRSAVGALRNYSVQYARCKLVIVTSPFSCVSGLFYACVSVCVALWPQWFTPMCVRVWGQTRSSARAFEAVAVGRHGHSEEHSNVWQTGTTVTHLLQWCDSEPDLSRRRTLVPLQVSVKVSRFVMSGAMAHPCSRVAPSPVKVWKTALCSGLETLSISCTAAILIRRW